MELTLPRIAVATLALLGLALALPESRISFVRPPAFVDRGVTVFNVRVPQHDDNRLIALAAFDTEDGNRVAYKEQQTHPDDLTVLRLELLLPSGDLAILAALYGSTGEIARTPLIPVRVQGPISEPE